MTSLSFVQVAPARCCFFLLFLSIGLLAACGARPLVIGSGGREATTSGPLAGATAGPIGRTTAGQAGGTTVALASGPTAPTAEQPGCGSAAYDPSRAWIAFDSDREDFNRDI